MIKPLHISESLALPLDFITATQAILAIKRIGKTYTASVEAEELLKAGQQIVAIDITGAWWGLRSNAAGDGPGFPVVIFGGDHGDVALEESAGEVIAEAIVTERFSAIIDLSLLRKGAAQRFLALFFETLYRRNREAMHLFMDEADFYAPQKPFGEEARVLGAVNDIVRRGGIRGIGCTLITQRASVLNKDVLTQAGIVTALRVSHPRDIKAILEWVDVHASREDAAEMLRTLPSLPRGDAWVWAPGWPTEEGIFKRIHIRKRETFDSGATPKAGHAQKQPKVTAEVDLKALGAQIAATVERQKANDPAALKKTIADLKRELDKAKAQSSVNVVTCEVAVPDAKAIRAAIQKRDEQWKKQVLQFRKDIEGSLKTAAAIKFDPPGQPDTEVFTNAPIKPVKIDSVALPRRNNTATVNGAGIKLPPGERAVLIAAAQYQDGVERDQLSVLTGYKRSSRDAYIQRLGEKNYIERRGDRLHITGAGIDALGGDYEPLPTGMDLQRYWMAKLPEGERRVLEILIAANGDSVSREIIDDTTGYKRSSRDAYLQRLSSRRLVENAGRGEVKAASTLFD